MISILIPTYDYTCYKLVYDLHEQAEALGVPYEIIVAEDGSKSPVTIIANHKITELSNCKHHIRKNNMGQAASRNELAELAQYEWLLFIDSDAKVDKADFLSTYVQHVDEGDVIFGGLHHQAENYDPNRTLRFKYEKRADKHRSAEERSACPYSHLTFFNLMLRKSVFMQIKLDKACTQYGYEDALFGVELKARNIPIIHIDNALLHSGLDTNESFVRKSETAIQTLIGLNGRMNGHCHVENVYNRLKSWHLAWIVNVIFWLFKRPIKLNLLSKNPSLFLFNMYKLGYYSSLKSLLLICMLACSAMLSAQTLRNPEKMSSMVRQIVRTNNGMHKVKGKASNQHLCAFVRVNGDAERVFNENGVKALANWGNIYIADIPISNLSSLAQSTDVERIEAGAPCNVTLDTTAVIVGVDKVWKGTNLKSKYDGSGVIIGVEDIGFDLTHPTYYSADMKQYRVKRLWDMLSTDTLNSKMYVGREYTTKDELLSLKHSYDGLIESHGTHTSSTAAGSGAEGNGKVSPYVGMAPGAELCLVANVTGDNSSLVDSLAAYKYTDAIDALGFKYIFDYAKSVGKPCVISFSEGSHNSFYGDEMMFGEVIDSISGPGRIVVSAAGNEGYNKTYLRKTADKESAGTFVYNGTLPYVLSVARSDDRELKFRVKFYNHKLAENLTCMIPVKDIFASEDSAYVDTVIVTEKDKYRVCVYGYPNCYKTTNDAYEVLILNLASGEVLSADGTSISVEMVGKGVEAEMFRYTGYFTENALDKSLMGATSEYNVLVPSCFPSVVSVGVTIYRTGVTNYLGEWKSAEKGSDGARSYMSSVGPSFSGEIKPDVMAPGCNVIAAYNSFYTESNKEAENVKWTVREFEHAGRTYPWTSSSGTSMACPVVAGTIALWLQAMPTLTTAQVKEVIANTSRHYDESLTYPNNYYGHGEIDAYAGLKYIEDTLIPMSIATIKQQNDGRIYNLQGQRVGKDYKGIIIINGKKYAQGQ